MEILRRVVYAFAWVLALAIWLPQEARRRYSLWRMRRLLRKLGEDVIRQGLIR